MKDRNLIKSDRLQEILKEIDICDTLIDLAADHGQLGYTVKKQNISKNVIVTDIRDSCILNMKKEYCDYLDIRKGNGLDIVQPNDNLDTLVIAGVGARTIVEILSKHDFKFNKYILVPHQDVEILREFLIKDYFIEKDRMIKDSKKYYNIIVARIGKKEYSEDYIDFGYNSYNDLIFREYINKEKFKIESRIPNASNEYKNKLEDKLNKINRLIAGGIKYED